MSVHYERLSNLDASFLALESRATHMHVGAVAVFSPGDCSGDDGVDIDVIRAIIASRLDQIPRYRQRLSTIPFEGHPVWVDDNHFHLDYHVRHVALPQPGTPEQLKSLAGLLMSQQLDRSRPLWELNVVEGLEGGGFAIITKIHHCMIDGMSGIDLMAVILDFTPNVELIEPKPWAARPAPNGTELAVREISRTISMFVANLADLSQLTSNIDDLTQGWSRKIKAASASLSSGWLTPTGRTPLNGNIGPARLFDWVELPLAGVKQIKDTHRVTVNDAMLAIVAGAVRSYLLQEGKMSQAEVATTEFRIMAPVSVRTKDESGTLGNKVAMWLMALPVGEPDPGKRIQIVKRETKNLKDTDQALGASTLVSVSTGAPATLVSLAARLGAKARPFNMTVTNVPGPQFPLYMAGSQMLATYPLVPLWQSHGAGIAMFSLNGSVDIGINIARDVIEDPPALARHIRASFKELSDAEPAEPKKKAAKKAAPMGTR
ncbi:MAG: wax ester/triacylglycerol synthase family O-acyltransferase [Acidimicrobiia bacterium]|nr:MAG: wax ester/triacylglycerol synthase family O-acyltransferase [Acidimicrobiia bacterium]